MLHFRKSRFSFSPRRLYCIGGRRRSVRRNAGSRPMFQYSLEFIRFAIFAEPAVLRCTPSLANNSLIFMKESHGSMNLTPAPLHSAPTLLIKAVALLYASLEMFKWGRSPSMTPLLVFYVTMPIRNRKLQIKRKCGLQPSGWRGHFLPQMQWVERETNMAGSLLTLSSPRTISS